MLHRNRTLTSILGSAEGDPPATGGGAGGEGAGAGTGAGATGGAPPAGGGASGGGGGRQGNALLGADDFERQIAAGQPGYMPPGAMKKVKGEFLERGRKSALAEQDATAKELGYESHAAMVESLRKDRARQANRQPPAAAPPPKGNNGDQRRGGGGDREGERLAKENERLRRENEEARKRAAREERARKEAQARAEVAETDSLLRMKAKDAGLEDPHYGAYLIHGEIQRIRSLPKDHPDRVKLDTEGIDEDAYFAELKTKKPSLFVGAASAPPVATPKPVTTGNGAGGPPSPDPKAAANAAGQKPVAGMNPRQFKDHIAKVRESARKNSGQQGLR